MYYYDIHTHKKYLIENEIAIHSISYKDFKEDIIYSDNIFFSLGIHPWDVKVKKEEIINGSMFEEILIKNPKIVAIGECGLDKLRGIGLEDQLNIFELQIYLSEKYKKPLIIHCVKAWEELIRVFKKNKPIQPWIIHGFRGNKELALQLIKLGFYLSLGEKFNAEALKIIPLNKLFIETDNSPINISDIYLNISENIFMKREELQFQIYQNIGIFDF